MYIMRADNDNESGNESDVEDSRSCESIDSDWERFCYTRPELQQFFYLDCSATSGDDPREMPAAAGITGEADAPVWKR